MVSVVVPIYNVEQFLPNCLESIINQTYDDLEIILINDGSTDGSLDICNKYASDDKRVRVVSQNNGGLSAARNTGIEISTGEYITFIDSDDEIELDMIEYLMRLIDDAEISVCQRRNITEDGRRINHRERKVITRTIQGNMDCMKEFLEGRDIDTVAWGKLYKRNLFGNVRYPVGRFHEDIFTTYLVVAQANKIVVGSEKKYLYRQRKSGISKISFTLRHLDSITGNLERKEYIAKNYPELTKKAEIGIIYATNVCTQRMAKAKYLDKNLIKELQILYKKYEPSFLKGNSSFVAKVYSLCGWCNLNLLISAYSNIWRIYCAFSKKNTRRN